MSGVNKVILVGRLGRDPELRNTQSGASVCSLSLATGGKRKTAEGKEYDDTEWHRVTVWGKQAEHCNSYLSKGRQVYVEGRLQTRKYEDKEGVTRYATEVVANVVQFLGSKDDAPAKSNQSGPPGETYAPPGGGDDDEIPF